MKTLYRTAPHMKTLNLTLSLSLKSLLLTAILLTCTTSAWGSKKIYIDFSDADWPKDGACLRIWDGSNNVTMTRINDKLYYADISDNVTNSSTLYFKRSDSNCTDNDGQRWNEANCLYSSSYNTYKIGSDWKSVSASYNVSTITKINYIYFDNSVTNWSNTYKYFVIGHDNPTTYSKAYSMSAIANTKLWYVANSSDTWSDATYYGFCNPTSTWTGTDWGSSNLTNGNKYTSAYTGKYNMDNGSSYLCIPSNSTNGTSFTIDYKDGYSALNSTQTIKCYVRYGGYNNQYTDYALSKAPGTISITSYELTGNGTTTQRTPSMTTSQNTQTVSAARTATTTLTAPAVEGYTFDGWYNTSGTQLSSNTTYTYYPTSATEIHARYSKTLTISATITPNIITAGSPTNITFNITHNCPSTSDNYGFVIYNFGSSEHGAGEKDGWQQITSLGTISHTPSEPFTLSSGTWVTRVAIMRNSVVLAKSDLIIVTAASTYTVTTAVNNSGWGIVTPTSVTATSSAWSNDITAAANPGFSFSSWSTSTGVTEQTHGAVTQVKATQIGTLTANFEEVTMKLNATVNNASLGSVSPTNFYAYASTHNQDVTATPANGACQFDNWSLDPNVTYATGYSATSNPAQFNITADEKTVTANFSVKNITDFTWTYHAESSLSYQQPISGNGTSGSHYKVYAGKKLALKINSITHATGATDTYARFDFGSTQTKEKSYIHVLENLAVGSYTITIKGYYYVGTTKSPTIVEKTVYYDVIADPTASLESTSYEVKRGTSFTLTAALSVEKGGAPYTFYRKAPGVSSFSAYASNQTSNTDSETLNTAGVYQYYATIKDALSNSWQTNTITIYVYDEYTFNVLKPQSWNNIYLYSWKQTTNGNTIIKDHGDFPGMELTPSAGGNGCYEVTIRSTYSDTYSGGYELSDGTSTNKTSNLYATASDDGKTFALTGNTANALSKTESSIIVGNISNTYGGMAGMPITIAPQISCCDMSGLTYEWTVKDGSTSNPAHAGAASLNTQSLVLTPTQGCSLQANLIIKLNGTQVYNYYTSHSNQYIQINVGSANDAGIIIRVYKDSYLESTGYNYNSSTWKWASGAPKMHYWYDSKNKYIYPGSSNGDGVLIEEGGGWYRYILPAEATTIGFELYNNSQTNCPSSGLDLSVAIHNVTESGCYIVRNSTKTNAGSDRRRQLEHLNDCGLYYRVKSESGSDTYYSNEVMKNGDDLSFYANASGRLTLQHYDDTDFGNSHWADVKTITNPSESNVQTAKFTGSDVTGMQTYTGDFYLWGNCMGYDTCSVHNSQTDFMSNRLFTKFDGNSDYVKAGEDYNYYWVDWVRGGFAQHQANSSFNSFWQVDVKATVGNEINHDLANRLGNDKYLSNGMVPTNGANIRFAYNPTTNYFSRAYLQGATERNYRFLCLYGTNVDILQYNSTDTYLTIDGMEDIVTPHWTGVFEDAGDWVYQLDVKADKTSSVVINAPYPNANSEDNYQYLLGDDHQHNLFGDESNVSTKITLRLIYDFKTNRLITGWVPDDGDNISIDLDASVIFTRVADGDLVQLKLIGENKIKHVQQVYTILEVTASGDTRWDKNGGFFWFSLPYDCKISNIFGLGNYGNDWEIQRYRGDLRAQQGWFQDTPTFWRTLKKTATLEANRGYVIYLKHAPTFRDNKPARVYFPSSDNQDFTFSSSETLHTELPYNACTICQGCASDPSREGNVRYDRRKEDSHWWIGGIPTLQNCTVKSIVNHSSLDASTQLKESMDPLYYYVWTYRSANSSTNYSAASSASGVEFKASHAYMFQYAGTINWQTATGISGPSSIVRHPAQQEETLLELEIALGDDNDIFDHTYITLNNNATTDYDMGMDLSKIMNDGPQIYSLVGSYNMAANQLPHSATEVPLGIVFPETGEYQLSLAKGMPAGKSVSIYDAAESREYSLENPVTIYADSAHTSVGRYSVRIQKKQGQITTAADNTLSGTISVTQADGRLFISGIEGRAEAMLYDMTGKLLYRTLVESGEGIAAPQQGIYLMRVAGQTLKINVR